MVPPLALSVGSLFVCAGVKGARRATPRRASTMPAAHRPLEGDELEGDLLWEARFASGMPVNLSGKSALVRRCLPLHHVQDGTSPLIAVVSLRMLMWLVVPSLTFDDEAGARVVAKYLVSPQRLGVALDAIVVQLLASLRRVEISEPGHLGDAEGVGMEGGASSGPSDEALESNLESFLERVHVSVLRENMAKAAKVARRVNRTAFTVQLGDLESLHEEEVDEGEAVEVFFPPWANFLVFSMLTSASGSAAPLAEAASCSCSRALLESNASLSVRLARVLSSALTR